MNKPDLAHGGLALTALAIAAGWYSSTRPRIEPRHERDEITVVRAVRIHGAPASLHCAGYRPRVKYGTDRNAGRIDPLPARTSIQRLTSFAHPPSISSTTPRRFPLETRAWRLHPWLLSFQLEPDQDYHLRLADGSGRTMIAELPSPLCTPPSSRLTNQIALARRQFLDLFGTKPQGRPNVRVHITGLGFWDFPHGGLGTAVNGIELHPVLSITRSR